MITSKAAADLRVATNTHSPLAKPFEAYTRRLRSSDFLIHKS